MKRNILISFLLVLAVAGFGKSASAQTVTYKYDTLYRFHIGLRGGLNDAGMLYMTGDKIQRLNNIYGSMRLDPVNLFGQVGASLNWVWGRNFAIGLEAVRLGRGARLIAPTSSLDFEDFTSYMLKNNIPEGGSEYQMKVSYWDFRLPLTFMFGKGYSYAREDRRMNGYVEGGGYERFQFALNPYIVIAPCFNLALGDNSPIGLPAKGEVTYHQDGQNELVRDVTTASLRPWEASVYGGLGLNMPVWQHGLRYSVAIELGYNQGLISSYGERETDGSAVVVNDDAISGVGKRYMAGIEAVARITIPFGKRVKVIDSIVEEEEIFADRSEEDDEMAQGVSRSVDNMTVAHAGVGYYDSKTGKVHYARQIDGRDTVIVFDDAESFHRYLEENNIATEAVEVKGATDSVMATMLTPMEMRERADAKAYRVLAELMEAESASADSTLERAVPQITFEFDSDKIKPESKGYLENLLYMMNTYQDVSLVINGYTDNVGRPAYNQKLSESRAKAVADWLIGNGILEERITYKGYGSENPIDTNETEQGRANNRRVEVLCKF